MKLEMLALQLFLEEEKVYKLDFFFKSESERKEQITIFLTASIYWLIGSQNVAPKGETTDSSKSRTDNTTL